MLNQAPDTPSACGGVIHLLFACPPFFWRSACNLLARHLSGGVLNKVALWIIPILGFARTLICNMNFLI
jgi:hypothetical protein